MITLYDNAFSPFARKVRMVLEYKGLAFEVIDGLLRSNHAALEAVNGRKEVPVLVDGNITVVNSADIASYLELRYPASPIYPADPAAHVHARSWERAADTLIDPILVDISYWMWADRTDGMPEGLLEAARADLTQIYGALDGELAHKDFVSGAFSIADIALFPHLASVRALNVGFSGQIHPNLVRWFRQLRAMPICVADLERTRAYVSRLRSTDIERQRIFWRGERIEWLLARGFHEWFLREIEDQRVSWPGLALPLPMAPRT